MRTLEWTRDDDHVWGPFLYAPSKYPSWAFVISSGDDEYRGASLRIEIRKHTLMVALPNVLIPPQKRKVYPEWDAATVARLGRDWYWDVTRRQFGFSLSGAGTIGGGSFLQLFYGRQTHDSSTDKVKGWFLPWTHWRFVRHSHYTATGQHIHTYRELPRGTHRMLHKHGYNTHSQFDYQRALPTIDFEFDDFDGERITAKTRIEEREWRFGEGWFSWLSLFAKPKIIRSLHLEFTKETGRRKGSWKGGTVGSGIDMLPAEAPEEAFRRYCVEHNMTFVSALPTEPDPFQQVAAEATPGATKRGRR